jgi:hypothetical protein
MKKNFEITDESVPESIRYSGLEPVYSREFIESEENEENNFFRFLAEVFSETAEDSRRIMKYSA